MNLETEVKEKKERYMSLLKKDPTLYKAYDKSANAALVLVGGVILAILCTLEGFFLVGVIIVIVAAIIYFKFDRDFERMFDETADDDIKAARKEYNDAYQRKKNHEKALKEENRAQEAQKVIQRKENYSDLNTTEQKDAHNSYDDEGEDDDDYKINNLEDFAKFMASACHRELVSSEPIYTENLSSTISQNTLLARSLIDKVVILLLLKNNIGK